MITYPHWYNLLPTLQLLRKYKDKRLVVFAGTIMAWKRSHFNLPLVYISSDSRLPKTLPFTFFFFSRFALHGGLCFRL